MKIKEILNAQPMLDLEGNAFMRIENYMGILEFTEQRLILKTKGMSYEILGKRLMIQGVTKREIYVTGEIEGLHIVKEAE